MISLTINTLGGGEPMKAGSDSETVWVSGMNTTQASMRMSLLNTQCQFFTKSK